MRRPSFARVTATVIKRAQKANRFGERPEAGRYRVHQCTFNPGGSAEINDGQQRTITSPTLTGPAMLAAVKAWDDIEVNELRYQVDGEPAIWPHHVIIRLKRVEG